MTNVAVDPAARRGGIATHLLLALADEGRRRECTAWTLEVRVSSTGAQELYRRVRLRAGRCPAALLREHRGRDRHVVQRHDQPGIRRAARPDPCRARRRAERDDPLSRRVHARARHRDELRRDRRRARDGRPRRRVERGVDAGRAARRVRRRGARDRRREPTSKCSTRWSPARSSRPASTTPASTPWPAPSGPV